MNTKKQCAAFVVSAVLLGFSASSMAYSCSDPYSPNMSASQMWDMHEALEAQCRPTGGMRTPLNKPVPTQTPNSHTFPQSFAYPSPFGSPPVSLPFGLLPSFFYPFQIKYAAKSECPNTNSYLNQSDQFLGRLIFLQFSYWRRGHVVPPTIHWTCLLCTNGTVAGRCTCNSQATGYSLKILK